jgi:uncharacterized protein
MKKRIFTLAFVLILCLALTIPTFGASAADLESRVIDIAGLLTSSEEQRLEKQLDQIGNEYDAYISIVTLKNSNSYDIEEYTEDLFFRDNFGRGASEDGILLVIDMSSRKWAIFANGICEEAISNSDIDDIGDEMTPDLSDGNYAEAFEIFAEECQDYLYRYTHFNWLLWIFIALVVGLIVALIVILILRGQLKSVRYRAAASDYIKPGSMKVTVSRDMFLYRTVSRRPRPKSNSSSGFSGGSRGSRGSGRF